MDEGAVSFVGLNANDNNSTKVITEGSFRATKV